MYKEYINKYTNGVSKSCLYSYFKLMYNDIVRLSTKTDYCSECFSFK